MKKSCTECKVKLSRDEIALSKKLIGPDTEEFYCLTCMSSLFCCTVEDLKTKIIEFKEQGCSLFV